jgi:hypothetical protein
MCWACSGQFLESWLLPSDMGCIMTCVHLVAPQEDSFHLVDNKPAQRKQGMRRFQPNRFQQRRDQQGQRPDMPHQDRQSKKQQQKRPQFFQRSDQRVSHSNKRAHTALAQHRLLVP